MTKNIFVILVLISSSCFASGQIGRLGVGMANQLVTNTPTLSMKLQRNRSSALGGIFGLDSSSEGSFYALGLKYYRLIYEEPQLNFYSAFSGAFFTYENTAGDSDAGNQFDGVFGTEFSFQGLESVGFSFEFGMRYYNYEDETHIATTGYNFISSAIHFYL